MSMEHCKRVGRAKRGLPVWRPQGLPGAGQFFIRTPQSASGAGDEAMKKSHITLVAALAVLALASFGCLHETVYEVSAEGIVTVGSKRTSEYALANQGKRIAYVKSGDEVESDELVGTNPKVIFPDFMPEEEARYFVDLHRRIKKDQAAEEKTNPFKGGGGGGGGH